jgi:exosome complex RNA-binding protein Csl4
MCFMCRHQFIKSVTWNNVTCPRCGADTCRLCGQVGRMYISVHNVSFLPGGGW